MGIILAESTIISALNAVQSQSYGPEARGGASKAKVIISDNEIDFPKVRKPDILLALTREAVDKYIADIRDNAIVIVDEKIEVPQDTSL